VSSPVFLSYTWDGPSLEGADALELALRLRGVPIWRDRRRMGWGDYKTETVHAAIGELCSGFALHYTEPVLDSEFVCDIELPAMEARRRRDPAFFSGALFRFGPVAQAAERLRERASVELGEPLGSRVVDVDPTEGLRAAANDILARYLRAQLDDNVVRVQVETRDVLPVESDAVLQLAWAPPLAHDAEDYETGVWAHQLQPALADLHQALTDAGAPRTLRVGGNMHLSAALALGYEFREPAGWSLQLERDGLSCFSDRVEPDLGGWRVVRSLGGGAVDHRLVVCVHASKNLDAAVTRHCGELAPAKVRVDISPPDGVAGKTTLTPESVNALAAAIAAELIHVRDAYGTTETHLYLACPWPLAALLGWHLGSCGRVVSHEAAIGRDTYRTSCVLL
jgi:hypothetical protein